MITRICSKDAAPVATPAPAATLMAAAVAVSSAQAIGPAARRQAPRLTTPVCALMVIARSLQRDAHAGQQRHVIELALDRSIRARPLGELQRCVEQILGVEVDLKRVID